MGTILSRCPVQTSHPGSGMACANSGKIEQAVELRAGDLMHARRPSALVHKLTRVIFNLA